MSSPTPPPVRKLGPGTLTVGAIGSPVDLAPRCTKASVTWKVDTSDDVVTLAGSTIAGDRTYTATLEATLYQDDLRAGEIVDFSWVNKGQQYPAQYQPFDGGRVITGEVIVDPIDYGGDVAKKNTSDIKWAFVGEPTLEDDLT